MRISAFLLCIVMIIGFAAVIPAAADEIPDDFWALNDKYTAAVEAKDNQTVIDLVLQFEEMFKGMEKSETVSSIMGVRYDSLILAMERMGRYMEAAPYLHKYREHANFMGWADAVKAADAKILHYTPVIDLYSPTAFSQSNYGAKLEPESGVLYGSTADGFLQSDNDSLRLAYLEFGEPVDPWLLGEISKCSEKGIALLLAWNIPGEGEQIKSVVYQTEYIKSILNVLEKYNNIPIYIRFAAEFNLWSNRAVPEEYISAFRHVSNLAKSITTNTAMVWSVNRVSSWDIDINDYYPGDEYVDWVGAASYAQKYFLGKNDWPDTEKYNEVVFAAGNSADAVKAMNEVITEYGGRKPVMITEGGVSYQIRPLNEDCSDWAKIQLQRQYYYLPMVYPQVKAIAYFDKTMVDEVNEYNISKSTALSSEYKSIVSSQQFLSRGEDKGVSYKKLGQSIEIGTGDMLLPVSAYVHTFGTDNPRVSYFIDGNYAAGTSDIPYSADIDLSGLSEGTHTLKVTAGNGQSVLYEKEYSLNITGGDPIEIKINGELLESDVSPVLYCDRTLVPLRVISEKLGFDVEWDEETQGITLMYDGAKIKLAINKNTAIVNGKTHSLDVPPKLFGERTLVPVRFISEAMGYKVDWHDNSVLISAD